jgi:hypothetical protein
MRCVGVAIAICSWIAVSNHCAVRGGRNGNRQGANRVPIPFQACETKEQSSQVQCCKVLRAVVFAKTKDWARMTRKFCDANFPVQAARSSCIVASCCAAVTRHRPPGAFSFAELILQQSLLAHAPPFVARAVAIACCSVGQPLRLPCFPLAAERLPYNQTKCENNFSHNRERTCAVGRAIDSSPHCTIERAPPSHGTAAGEQERNQNQNYTCLMHPEVITDHPGSCPKCGMKLVPVAEKKRSTSNAVKARGPHGALRAQRPTSRLVRRSFSEGGSFPYVARGRRARS